MSELTVRHNIPHNCNLLSAPKINLEVEPALTQAYLNRDNCYRRFQDHLGKGLSALGKGINSLLELSTNKECNQASDILPHLVDAGRILTGLFHDISITRRNLITNTFSRTVKVTAETTQPDEFLFGREFGEKVKTAQNLEKIVEICALYAHIPAQKPPQRKKGGSQSEVYLQYHTDTKVRSFKPTTPVSPKEGSETTERATTSLQEGTQEVQPAAEQRPLEVDPPTSQGSPPDGREIILQAFITQGVDELAARTMLSSISESTIRQYSNTYKLWYEYCTTKNIPLYRASVKEVITFLQGLYSQGNHRYGTFNTHRSALSLILHSEVGNNSLLKRYLRGIARGRPQKPKYNHTWDPSIVLRYLELPANSGTLRALSHKTVTLLALITGGRLQTISLICVSNNL
nr:unnamed protein product [Callosobruchus analis]